MGVCSMYKEITISKDSIESIVKKDDAIIIYLKSGKCWVCESITEDCQSYIKLTLKGKSDK